MLVAATTFAQALRILLDPFPGSYTGESEGHNIHQAKSLDQIGMIECGLHLAFQQRHDGSEIPAGATITW